MTEAHNLESPSGPVPSLKHTPSLPWRTKNFLSRMLHRHLRFSYTVGDVKIPGGLHISPTMHVIFSRGSYEGSEATILRETLDPGDRVLELGAGIGFISTICARIVTSGSVACIEANPAMIPVISKTHQLNGVKVSLLSGLVAKTSGVKELHTQVDFWSSSLHKRRRSEDEAISKGTRTIVVETMQLSDLLDRFQPTYLICDIEGAEIEVFEEVQLPLDLRHILLETHPHIVGEEATRRLRDYLERQGFGVRMQYGRVICYER